MLSRTGGKRRRGTSPGKRHSAETEPPGDGDRDEAANFIAEVVCNLAAVAQTHGLDHLRYLLAIALLEAEEHLRLRSQRRLS